MIEQRVQPILDTLVSRAKEAGIDVVASFTSGLHIGSRGLQVSVVSAGIIHTCLRCSLDFSQ
jgi:hypothetical protein